MKSMDFAKFENLYQTLVKCVSCYGRTPTPRNRAAKKYRAAGPKGSKWGTRGVDVTPGRVGGFFFENNTS